MTSRSEIKIDVSTNIGAQTENNNNDTNISINLVQKKSQFEIEVVNAYIKLQSKSKTNVIDCEKALNDVINLLSQSKNDKTIQIVINNVILDRLKRICHHKALTLSLLVGKIFIALFHIDNLFTPKKDENLVIFFINEGLKLMDRLKSSSISKKYDKNLLTFLKSVIDSNYDFIDEQKESLNMILTEHFTKQTQKPLLKFDSFPNFVTSISDEILKQETFCEQYRLILDNKNQIIEQIKTIEEKHQDLYEQYLTLGKLLSFLMFNKRYHLYMNKSYDNDENISHKIIYENRDIDNINFLQRESYYIELEEDINQYRVEIIPIIIEYISKIQVISKVFEFQYISYLMLRRIYINFFIADTIIQKTEIRDAINNCLSVVMINLCSFPKEQCEDARQFFQYLIENDHEKNKDIKMLLEAKMKEKQSDPLYDFNAFYENNPSPLYEGLSLYDFDLKYGFFNSVTIPAGEVYSFYIELEKKCSVLDFGFFINENDFTFRMIDITDKQPKEVMKFEKISVFEVPMKLTLFNSRTAIYKIEFDNSYSWFNSKEIKFKFNIFYPENELEIIHKLDMIKLKNQFNSEEDIGTLSVHKNKILYVKLNKKDKIYNSGNILNNITKMNTIIKKKTVSISDIYIDQGKKVFYDNEFKSHELNLESFSLFLNEKYPVRYLEEEGSQPYELINVFDITGNQLKREITSLENVLGFSLNTLDNDCIIFFPCLYTYTCLLTDLYHKVLYSNKFDIIIHINYFKQSGFQISLFKDGVIFSIIEGTEQLNKDGLEQDFAIIKELVDKYKNEGRVIEVVLSSDDIDNVNKDKIWKENDDKINVVMKDSNYYREISTINPVLYLDE